MTAEEARRRLERMVAAATYPPLDEDDIDELLVIALHVDGTYELNAAAAEGWRWKAGRVVPDRDIAIDDQKDSQSAIHKHCLAQIILYEARANAVAARGGSYSLNTLAPPPAESGSGSGSGSGD
jgi:hypothetical protein